jgi:hypothetical protein
MSLSDITNTFINSDFITQQPILFLNSDLITQPNKKIKNNTYDPSMRLQIAEYPITHGNANASRKFEVSKPTISGFVIDLKAARQKKCNS